MNLECHCRLSADNMDNETCVYCLCCCINAVLCRYYPFMTFRYGIFIKCFIENQQYGG